MNSPRLLTRSHYITAAVVGLAFSAAIVIVCIVVASLWGGESSSVARIVKVFSNLSMNADGHIAWAGSMDATYLFPFSIQAVTYFAFGTAWCLIIFRGRICRLEEAALAANLLPDDERTLIQPADIADVREKIDAHKNSIIVTLIERSLQQYQTTLSTSEAASIVTANGEALLNEVDGHYSMIRYLAWAIPSLGFIGTVMGIGQALTGFRSGGNIDINMITSNLSSAFDTTLVALMLSIVLMLIISRAESREESVVTTAQSYALSNLVNRLFNPEIGRA